jgi:tyrosyl-tRNA synthetase
MIMTLSEELKWRGFSKQTTYEDLSSLDGAPISFYFGVDPSADSMTIGNLASVMMARHFISHGHKAYILVGGATGMIGDPDGKIDERNLKTLEDINRNKEAIKSQYHRLFSELDVTIVDNYDWFKDINYLDFLRNVGKHVPMSQMLGRDFVQSRLGGDGSGISYAEFSYALIQAYDFLYLNRNFGVSLQICGADQWGNSVAGVDLIRRLDGKVANVYSMPLIVNKTTGVKFGKSEAGAVWLDPAKTSVYQFYQFWLNTDDASVIDYLKIFTLLDKNEVDDLSNKLQTNPELRLAQKTLAHTVTTLVHGSEQTASVERVTDVLFSGADFATLQVSDLDMLACAIPVASVGKNLVETMVSGGLATSNSQARQLIESGAVSSNGHKISDNTVIDSATLIKKGKNSFLLIR